MFSFFTSFVICMLASCLDPVLGGSSFSSRSSGGSGYPMQFFGEDYQHSFVCQFCCIPPYFIMFHSYEDVITITTC